MDLYSCEWGIALHQIQCQSSQSSPVHRDNNGMVQVSRHIQRWEPTWQSESCCMVKAKEDSNSKSLKFTLLR